MQGYQVDPTRTLTYTAQDGVLYYHFTGNRFIAMSPSGPDAFTIGTRALHRFDRVDGKLFSVTASAQGADWRGARTGAKPPAVAILGADDLKGLVGTYRGPTADPRHSGREAQKLPFERLRPTRTDAQRRAIGGPHPIPR